MIFPFPLVLLTGELLQDSDRQELRLQGREASLTVPCAHKEDEGFYSIRVPSLQGDKEQTTYVFVRGICSTHTSPWHKGIPTRKQLLILCVDTIIAMTKSYFWY